MIIDSDVLIWNFRGHAKAAAVLARQPFKISAVTFMEVVQGMRNLAELRVFRLALTTWQAQTVFIDDAICGRAMAYVEAHFHRSGLRMADALIAATAWSTGEELLHRQYEALPAPIGDIVVHVFKP